MRTLSTYVQQDQLLALAPRELAAVILRAIRDEPHHSHHYHPQEARFAGGSTRDSEDIRLAIAEAWQWLHVHLVMVPIKEGAASDYSTLSRVGREVLKGRDLKEIAALQFIASPLVHEAIRSEVASLYLRGRYDTAIFEAMKAVEISVRESSGAHVGQIGVPLMRFAFDAETGPLRDPKREAAERLAEAHLFAGSIGAYRNAVGHRDTEIGPEECSQALVLASMLLRIVDARK